MCLHQFIRIDDFPEHFHQMNAFIIRKPVLDGPGKTEQLHRIFDLAFRRLDKFMCFVMCELETMFAKPLYPVAFCRAEFCICRRRIDKQHSGCKMELIGRVTTGFADGDGFFIFEEGFETIKHNGSYHRCGRSANHMQSWALHRATTDQLGYGRQMNTPPDKARHFPATARNRDVIADVLKRYLPAAGTVLEIGSGSGEHSVYFAGLFPDLHWQPSDPDPLNIDSIAAWAETAGADNLRPPLPINASDVVLPLDTADAMMCINVIHISPWDATEGLMRNAAKLLPPGALLYLYGPYRIDGVHTASSNEAFDLSLRSQNETWGVRDLEDVCAEAEKNGLGFVERVEMPSNNQSVIFRKSS